MRREFNASEDEEYTPKLQRVVSYVDPDVKKALHEVGRRTGFSESQIAGVLLVRSMREADDLGQVVIEELAKRAA